jgi:hypothetical protein
LTSGTSANVAVCILAICKPYLVSLCEFAICVTKLFCGLMQIRKCISSPYKCSSYTLKSCVVRTCDRISYDFALKGPKKYKLFKRYVISPPNGENLRFSISGLAHLRNLRICGLIQKNSGFAICRLAHTKKRNLRICDSGTNPKIYGFAICGPKYYLRAYLYSWVTH